MDDEYPTYEEAELEASYPKQVRASSFYKAGVRYDIDTSEVNPNKFETMIFSYVLIGGHWVEAKNNELKHVGEVFYNDREAAINYHQEWVEFFTFNTHRPKFRRI